MPERSPPPTLPCYVGYPRATEYSTIRSGPLPAEVWIRRRLSRSAACCPPVRRPSGQPAPPEPERAARPGIRRSAGSDQRAPRLSERTGRLMNHERDPIHENGSEDQAGPGGRFLEHERHERREKIGDRTAWAGRRSVRSFREFRAFRVQQSGGRSVGVLRGQVTRGPRGAVRPVRRALSEVGLFVGPRPSGSLRDADRRPELAPAGDR
jgi:hypothetical protein